MKLTGLVLVGIVFVALFLTAAPQALSDTQLLSRGAVCGDCDTVVDKGCIGLFCTGTKMRCTGTSTALECKAAGTNGKCSGSGGECPSTPANEKCS